MSERTCPHCGCGCGSEALGAEDIVTGDAPSRRWIREHGDAKINELHSALSDSDKAKYSGIDWHLAPENLLRGQGKPCDCMKPEPGNTDESKRILKPGERLFK